MTALKHPEEGLRMFPLLGRYLIENWTEVLPGAPPPNKLSFVQLPGSRVSTFLILGDRRSSGYRRPDLVIKIPRTPAGEAYLRLEYQNLERLAARLAGAPRFLEAIPKAISLCAIGGKTVLILEGVPGSRLHTFPTGGLGALSYVCRWLTELQAATRTQLVPTAQDVEEMFLEPIRKFAKGSELSAAVTRFLARLEDRARALEGAPLPLTLTHGDFSVSNILLDVASNGRSYEGARISVIDWARSLDAGLPIRDLWHLLTAYAKGLTPRDSSGRITFSLAGSSYARTVRSWLDQYCQSLGLPRWFQGLCIAFEYIYGALDYPWGIETDRRARYLGNLEAFVGGISENDEDRPFALLPDQVH